MTDVAVQAAASLIAGRLFDQALEERSGAFGSLRQGRLKASVEIEARLDFERGWLRLSLRLAPAGISPGAALLPGDWLPRFERSRELWLTGRNLLPGRGLERAFGDIKKGPAVYITRWGVCYHQWGCRYLAKSRIAADLSVCFDDFPLPDGLVLPLGSGAVSVAYGTEHLGDAAMIWNEDQLICALYASLARRADEIWVKDVKMPPDGGGNANLP